MAGIDLNFRLKGSAAFEGSERSVGFTTELDRQSQRFHQPRRADVASPQRRWILLFRQTTYDHRTLLISQLTSH